MGFKSQYGIKGQLKKKKTKIVVPKMHVMYFKG